MIIIYKTKIHFSETTTRHSRSRWVYWSVVILKNRTEIVCVLSFCIKYFEYIFFGISVLLAAANLGKYVLFSISTSQPVINKSSKALKPDRLREIQFINSHHSKIHRSIILLLQLPSSPYTLSHNSQKSLGRKKLRISKYKIQNTFNQNPCICHLSLLCRIAKLLKMHQINWRYRKGHWWVRRWGKTA